MVSRRLEQQTSCALTLFGRYSWPSMEVSPSPVYGARLLSGLRASTLSRVQIPPPPPPRPARSCAGRFHIATVPRQGILC